MSRLAARTAIVTGAGQGIGRSVALKLAEEGASVVVNDLDVGLSESTVDEIVAAGGQAVSCAGSVTEDGFSERFVDLAVSSFGSLDIIVNNAGYTWDSVIQNMTDEQWDAMQDVHVKAPFRILRAAQPIIRSQARADADAGRPVTRKVVNVTSISGTDGQAGQANYSAAKAGVVGLTLSLAKEWGRYNTTVNAVGFGFIRTRITESRAVQDGTFVVDGHEVKAGLPPDRFAELESLVPLGRAGTPEEAAGAVYLLCSPESDYVSGEVLICGGGYHF